MNGHGAGGDRLAMLAQGLSHRTQRCLGDRLHRMPGRPAASVPGTGLAPLLRRIGVAGPGRPDFREVPRAVCLAADPAGFLGPAHRRLADPELPCKLPITDHAHPYKGPEVKL
jgi:hypothetical protein